MAIIRRTFARAPGAFLVAITLMTAAYAGRLPVQAVAVLYAAPSTHSIGSARVASSDQAAIEATLRAMFSATVRHDITALDTLYAGDSLTVIEGSGINRGWADYRDHHLVPELGEMKNLVYVPSDIEVHVTGPVAWSIFRYGLQTEANGHRADVVGRGTAVFERRGSRWVIRHIHTSGRARHEGDPPLVPGRLPRANGNVVNSRSPSRLFGP